MGSVSIYYQPPLSLGRHTTTTDDDDCGGSWSIDDARSASARRISSFGNTALVGDDDLGSGGELQEQQQREAAGITADNARIKRCQTAPGYVSFEDVIGGGDEASSSLFFGREGRSARRRLSELDGIVIRDPLVRAASRLYALDTARGCRQLRRLSRRRSPGPLGTRRGSFLHRLVNKYVSPCLGFLAKTFLCG